MQLRRLTSVLVVAVPAAGIALIRRRRRRPSTAAASEPATGARADLTDIPAGKAAAAPSASARSDAAATTATGGDDLKVIEGIGPRIEEVLKAAGIATYAELADQSRKRLETIMKEAGTRLANPETWAEQARLAAASEWDALRDLQSQLKRGRRVTS